MTDQKNKLRMKLSDLPVITPQMIQDLINRHIASLGKYHGHFHCGKQLGYGASGVVYQLRYEAGIQDKDTDLYSRSLAAKLINPIQTFLESNQCQFTKDAYLYDLLNDECFTSYKQTGSRCLQSISLCQENRFYEHHFVRYYPELSFSINEEIPFASIIVMDEVAGTLNQIKLPEDMHSMIRMIVKLGKEIGDALQISEYADEGETFLHRDLKPGNIGIVINLDNPEIYKFVLIDIESGIFTGNHAGNSANLVMNFFSQAPELSEVSADDEIDYTRVDMFNLGELMRYISQGQFDLLPEGLKRVIIKASHKNPSHRYDNGDELIEDLVKFEKNFDSDGGRTSINLRRYMDEQKEKLAENKRQFQVRRNELNEKLDQKRSEINSLKAKIKALESDVKTWKENYDHQIDQEKKLKQEFEAYKVSVASPGNLVTEITMRQPGVRTVTVQRHYDEDGRLIREFNPESREWVAKEYSYRKDGKVLVSFLCSGALIADELLNEKNLTQEITSYRNHEIYEVRKFRYTYNRRGFISSVYINNVLSEKHTYDYDDKDSVKQHTVEISGGQGSLIRIEQYNQSGFPETLITWRNSQTEENPFYTKITYSYDDNNLEVKAVFEDENHQVFRERNRFYDKHRRLTSEISVDYVLHRTVTREFKY